MKTNRHFWLYLAQFLLEWEMFLIKFVQKIKTRLSCSITFLENRVLYERKWKNIIQPGRPQRTIWYMGFSSCIPNSTNTYSQYAILIAFPTQQWFHERTAMLRYTYNACFVEFNLKNIVKNKYFNYVIFYLANDNVQSIRSHFNNCGLLFVRKITIYNRRTKCPSPKSAHTWTCLIMNCHKRVRLRSAANGLTGIKCVGQVSVNFH